MGINTNRNNCCPKCGGKLLARCGDKIFCLDSSCEWFVISKREDDKKLPDIHELKDNWQ